MSQEYRPALQHHSLTRFYDVVLLISGLGPSFKKKITAIANLPPIENGMILDVGSGSGTHANLLAAAYQSMQVVGVDPDEKFIEQSIKKFYSPNLSFIKTSADVLPYADNSVDYIFSTLTFHHLTLSQKVAALKEFHRVIKPDGSLILTDWGLLTFPIFKYYLYIIEDYECIESHLNGHLPSLVSEFFSISQYNKVKMSGIWLMQAIKK